MVELDKLQDSRVTVPICSILISQALRDRGANLVVELALRKARIVI
jgi:hypothetical protein